MQQCEMENISTAIALADKWTEHAFELVSRKAILPFSKPTPPGTMSIPTIAEFVHAIDFVSEIAPKIDSIDVCSPRAHRGQL